MTKFIPVHIEVDEFKEKLKSVNNGKGPIIVHSLILDTNEVISVVVEYYRYNGSSSRLGLWTKLIEVVPATEIWSK